MRTSRKKTLPFELQSINSFSGIDISHWERSLSVPSFFLEITTKISKMKTIKRVASAKSFHVTVDERLSWDKHIVEKSKNSSAAIGAHNRARPFISTASATQIYQALI